MAALSPDIFMRQAIALSRKGFPAPNPRVGCVIEKNGEIVGQGYCHYDGSPHAEVLALGVAGERARGATAYVTLEPCNHHGRTPPCSVALVNAGVAKVVFAVPDPNVVASGGAQRLRSAGVEVVQGLLEAEASEVNVQFLTAQRRGWPFVVVKAAISLDGRVALNNGVSKWITDDRARVAGHRLRAECGAVLVGRSTFEVDAPKLTARLPGVKVQPLRVILDPQGKLKDRLDDRANLLHVTGHDHGGDLEITVGAQGFDLSGLLRTLFLRGVTGLLVEGGPATSSYFVRTSLVDQLEIFVSPKLLGNGPAWFDDNGTTCIEDDPRFALVAQRRVGRDIQLSYKSVAPSLKP